MGAGERKASSYTEFVGEQNEWDTRPRFTVRQMAAMTGLTEHVVRYYDKLHLFPFVGRSRGNARLFSLADAFFGRAIACFRDIDMSLDDCRTFVELTLQGDRTVSQRAAMLKAQEELLRARLERLHWSLDEIRYKRMFFESIEPEIARELKEGTFSEKGRSTLRASRVFIQNKMFEDGLIDHVEIEIPIPEADGSYAKTA